MRTNTSNTDDANIKHKKTEKTHRELNKHKKTTGEEGFFYTDYTLWSKSRTLLYFQITSINIAQYQ